MSTINFPQNPTLNELYPFGGKTWQWNGSYWGIYSGTSLSIVDINYSATTGELWYTKSDLSQNKTSEWSYFTGGSYNTSTREITLSANTGGTFTISNLDYNGVTDLSYDIPTRILSISRPSGPDSVDLSSLIGNLVYSGTYNSTTGVVTFYPVDGAPFTVPGFLTGYTNTYTTGFTYNPNTGLIQFNRTDLQNAYSGFTSYYVSGTTNYIPKFNSTGVTNSQIFDNGSLVTIGYGNNTVTSTELLVSGYTKLGQSLSSTATKTLMISGDIAMEQVAGPTGLQLTGITFTSNAGSGSLSAGTYNYDICFITAEGETECVISNVYFASGVSLSNGSSMTLNNVPTSSDPRVTGRRIFRTVANQASAGSGQYFCYSIGTINDNTTTTYVDTTSDSFINPSTLRVNYRKGNTTAGQIFIRQGNQNTRTLYSDQYDTVLGVGAYANNIAGSNNIAIGGVSLRDNTTGNNSVSIGYASSFRTTGGSDNVSIGYTSNYVNPGGAGNVAVGSLALRGSTLTNQNNNVAIGFAAMFTTSGSSNSVGIGYYTGRNFYGNNNTFIGYSTSSYSSQRGGNYNIFIGNSVGNSITGTSNMDNNILIGYGVNPPNLGGSNQLNIGNLLYSNSLGSTTTQSTGGLGVGVTVPGARLDVSPTSAQIGVRISGSSSTDMVRITQSGTGISLNIITTGGTIGIGTSSPFYFLQSLSTSNADAVMMFDGGTGANANLVARADTTLKLPVVVMSDRNNAYGVSTSFYIGLDRFPSPQFAGRNDSIYVNNYNDKGHYFVTTNNVGTKSVKMSILGGGNVGIGTSSPSTKSILDLTSTSQGFLPPRMTNVQITGITSPPEGLVAYSTDAKTLVFYNGTSWQKVTANAL